VESFVATGLDTSTTADGCGHHGRAVAPGGGHGGGGDGGAVECIVGFLPCCTWLEESLRRRSHAAMMTVDARPRIIARDSSLTMGVAAAVVSGA